MKETYYLVIAIVTRGAGLSLNKYLGTEHSFFNDFREWALYSPSFSEVFQSTRVYWYELLHVSGALDFCVLHLRFCKWNSWLPDHLDLIEGAGIHR